MPCKSKRWGSELTDRRVIKPSRLIPLFLLFMGPLFIALGIHLILYGEPDKAVWGWLTALIFGGTTILMLTNWYRDVPSITLTPAGIEHRSAFKTSTWRWSEVGPFVVSIYVFRRGLFSKRFRSACAFSDRDSDLLTAQGREQNPTYVDADISLPLTGFDAGRSDEAANAFVDELNEWRDRYGRPEVDVDHSTAAKQLAEFEAGTARRRTTFMLSLMIVFAALFALVLYEKQVSKWLHGLLN